MIVGHCCQWASCFDEYLKYSVFLSVFMPWFFFKGGMFFRAIPFKEEVKRSGKRLLLPFIVFSILGTLILWTILLFKNEFQISAFYTLFRELLIGGSVRGNLPLWFLPSLFMARLIFGRLCTSRTSSKHNLLRGGVFTTCIITIFAYHYLNLSDYHIPLYIFNIPSGLIFFALGFYLRDLKYSKRFTLAVTLAYISLMLILPTAIDIRSGQLLMGYFLLWIPTALLGILSLNGIFKNLFDYKCILSRVGKETMSYYCLHWCIIVIVSCFFTTMIDKTNWQFLVCSIIVNAVLLPILTDLISKSRFFYIIK
ncbi:MAG: acyltransferase [Muribaculum sp.]|nr:acyltransferase [Muribaculum sp.]